MQKPKAKTIIFTLILLASIAIGTKPLWTNEESRADVVSEQSAVTAKEVPGQDTQTPGTAADTGAVTLTQLLDSSFATGKPVAVVLTYDADCCPDTKEFFDEHRTTTQEIEKKYREEVSFAWIDIAIYDQLEHDKLMEVAEELNVNSVPALVLLDNNRKVIKSWIGELNQEEVSQAIEQVVN